ncbi:hypothetical protein KEH56_36575 [Burkholderia cenocepacia]|uniref:hypothetical protein n=1 Tax=Burkholderia cenocepacia TaxID=95486 RepID=UPI001BA72802|nr:hypothetical protein [Burkholderia cenocepacia]QUN44688.1 hypothetical protein KEH56_36575 [Burkholderia cenocepacia]
MKLRKLTSPKQSGRRVRRPTGRKTYRTDIRNGAQRAKQRRQALRFALRATQMHVVVCAGALVHRPLVVFGQPIDQ